MDGDSSDEARRDKEELITVFTHYLEEEDIKGLMIVLDALDRNKINLT